MKSLPVTLRRILDSDPRVDEIWDERCDNNGYWIYFKPGWINPMTETHCIHELTVKECVQQLRDIQPCDCKGCELAA